MDGFEWDERKRLANIAERGVDYPVVLEWFRRQGKGHLTRMSAVLRAYMEANREKR